MSAWIERVWYDDGFGRFLLLPLTLLYATLIAIRRILYRFGVFPSITLPVPVVVVGNIVAGGAGKTPVTLFVAEGLRKRGLRPGIVSRGYGRKDEDSILEVTSDSGAKDVGDEPLLLARRSGCPVVVGRDRVAAAERVIQAGANVIIADDGLQHYRLGRDFEICVVDGRRGLGNGHQLPAGPLREPATRLENVDAVLVNSTGTSELPGGLEAVDRPVSFTLEASIAASLDDTRAEPLESFADAPIVAVAGIGNPERFFQLLERHGLTVIRQPLPDHASLDPESASFGAGRTLLVTEKDAVKLDPSSAGSIWYVPVDLEMDDAAASTLLDAIETRCRQRQDSGHE